MRDVKADVMASCWACREAAKATKLSTASGLSSSVNTSLRRVSGYLKILADIKENIDIPRQCNMDMLYLRRLWNAQYDPGSGFVYRQR
jgi:hypothetical protein